VGGIAANSSRPAEFISDTLRIQVNLFDSAVVAAGVERFLFLGSSCIYPKFAEQPIREDALLTRPLEPTNDGYAVAKIAGIAQLAAIRQQHHLPYISARPTSTYGPGDTFDPRDSHVVPALIRRFHQAARDGATSVTCWGTGRPQREFIYVDELADLVAEIVGYHGEIKWDPSKPDGTPRKLLDTRRLDALGWKAKTSLAEGIQATYEWYLAHQGDHRC
jgi:GDP-L-fucose synthase